MKKLLLFSICALLIITLVSAGSTCLTLNSKTTLDYLNELQSLNSQLSTCTVTVPSVGYKLVGEGNVLFSILMNSGSTEQFYISIKNQKVESFNKGSPSTHSFEVKLNETTFDKILQSNDPTNSVLKGVKSKDIKIRANTFIGKIKWFFAKFFLPNPTPSTTPSLPTGPTGKPDNCDETYLPGHREYANNKALWDGYSLDADKVCQSQFGKGTPSPCIHSVQLSINGNPYYLCWYNE
jgi:hypothetical protein